MATQHSQKCCEELVAAGAIDILLKLIRSVSRSIPDQEVLKHALSILRNLTRYPHLTEVLIKSSGSVEIILWELLRNKEEGYFIAAEVLKKLFLHHKGIEAAHKLPALVKRLHNHVEELSRKAKNDKRVNEESSPHKGSGNCDSQHSVPVAGGDPVDVNHARQPELPHEASCRRRR
nr:abnormal spindle-like microcephaly-associated protein homolog isoform X2 [Ipomoea batatas]